MQPTWSGAVLGMLLVYGGVVEGAAPFVGPELQVNDPNVASQFEPAVGPTSAGGFVIVWRSNETGSYHVRGRRFGANADPLGAEFSVDAVSTGYYGGDADVSPDGGGGFVVVWSTDYDSGSSSLQTIDAQRFGADGTPQGVQLAVAAGTSGGYRFGSRVAALAQGGFVVVWTDSVSPQSDTSQTSVQAQRFSDAGVPSGPQIQVNTYTTGSQLLGGVAPDGTGGFVVVWSSGPNGRQTSIQARRFASDGSPAGSEFQVNAYTTGYYQAGPAITSVGGSFVVVWRSGEGGTGAYPGDASIEGRMFSADGLDVGPQFQVSTYTPDFQGSPDVAEDGVGGFVVVWHSRGSEGTDSEYLSIQGRRFDRTGRPVSDQFQVNTYTSGSQAAPRVERVGEGFVVAWATDLGGPDTDIRAQRFDARGIAGRKLLLRDRSGKPDKRQMRLVARDRNVTLGDGPGSASDPTVAGATLRVVSAGFDATYDLAAANWSPLDGKRPEKGWKYTRGDPIRKVVVKARKGLRIVGNGAGLDHTLAQDPGPVDVVLTLAGRQYCMEFDGTLKGNVYRARKAAAPDGCPAPGS